MSVPFVRAPDRGVEPGERHSARVWLGVVSSIVLGAVGCDGEPPAPDASGASPTDVAPRHDTGVDSRARSPGEDARLDTDAASADASVPEEDARSETSRFPGDFMFGTATSGFQVEMGCPTLDEERCTDSASDWYAFVTSPETVDSQTAHLSGDSPSKGAGFWETYRGDLDRAAEMNNDAFRMSLEWSRLFPEATDDAQTVEELHALVDRDALNRYRRILEAARERGLEPVVTVNHYTLPAWIHDGVGCHVDFEACERRGWLDRDRIVREIAKYARFLAATFGDEVDWWATVNEPMAVVLPGYLRPTERRTNPPAVTLKMEAARRAMHSMILAHAEMYDAIRAADEVDADGDGREAKIGLAANFSPVSPSDPGSEVDREAAENVSYLFNRAFVEPLVDGAYDPDLDGEGERREDLNGRLDWVGMNYYGAIDIEGRSHAILPELSPLTTFDPFDFSTTYDRPEQLETMLRRVDRWWELPVLVTENGTTVEEREGQPLGSNVPGYMVAHLDSVAAAMREGVEVEGYLYWSLLDTYEWNHGMGVRMGLYGFDPEDPEKERRARPAVEAYGRIAEAGRVTPQMRAEYLGTEEP